jgi:hypothetical protein
MAGITLGCDSSIGAVSVAAHLEHTRGVEDEGMSREQVSTACSNPQAHPAAVSGDKTALTEALRETVADRR